MLILLYTEGSTGSLVARHSLSYIQEIGNGLFGKVSLMVVIETDSAVVPRKENNTPGHMRSADLLQYIPDYI